MEGNQEIHCWFCPLKPGRRKWLAAIGGSLLIHAVILGILFSKCGAPKAPSRPVPVIPTGKASGKAKHREYFQIELVTKPERGKP